MVGALPRISCIGALFCLLLTALPAWAGQGASLPSASCGSGTLTVPQGGTIPGPSQFSNPTGVPVLFEVTMRANALFGAEKVVFTRTLLANLGVNQPTAIPVPYSTALGTDRVIIEVTSPNTGATVLGRCDYTLTVTVPYPNVIIVPLRLCVLEGAAEADGQGYPRTSGRELLPFTTYLTTQRTRVRELVQETSDRVWLPQARIMFKVLDAPYGIPVLPDRDVTEYSNAKANKELGNVDALSTGQSDQKEVGADCALAWQQLYGIDKGIVFTIVHEYARGNNEVGIAGVPDLRFWVSGTQTEKDNGLCSQPRKLTVPDVDLGSITLIDPATPKRAGGFFSDLIVEIAHELGHDLLLGHGNGLDDNGDGLIPSNDGLTLSNPGDRRYDHYCDSLGTNEDPPTGQCEGLDADEDDPASVMNAATTPCTKLWPLQIEQARAAARLKPGAVTVPNRAAELLSTRPCSILSCGIPPDVLTWKAELAETLDLDVTTFAHTLFGPIDPSSMNTEYLFFADLDNDASTGCPPSAIGLPTSFQGAEIVTRVHVVGSNATPTAWKCTGTGLVPLSDPGIRAHISIHGSTSQNDEPPSGIAKIVIEVPNAVRGALSDYVRVQTVSRQLSSSAPLFRIPADPSAGGVLSLAPLPSAECFPSPSGVRPGESLTLRASRLAPLQALGVWVGSQPVASGLSTLDGEASITFVLPANTETGARQVSISQVGTSAVCALQVYGTASGPSTVATVTPWPNASGWNSGPVTVSLLASPGSSGMPIRDVTYAVLGSETVPSTTIPGNVGSFTLIADGLAYVAYAARDTSNIVEGTESLVVRIDGTPPQITASQLPVANARGWNNTSIAVQFSCQDQTSGITACPIPVILNNEGTGQSATGLTSDFAGHEASASVSGINIDLTSPVVAYNGGAVEYTVDQTVLITCVASDALSGILSSTCQNVAGPAYSFPLGANTFSATATDNAGNQSTAQVSFGVKVTFGSLCTLVRRFSTQAGVATSLCAKLSSAADAAARGQLTAKRGALTGFVREVAAQSGNALPSALAGTLVSLSDGL